MSTDLVVVLFSIANALRVFAYVPQIVMLMRDDTGAAGISCSTWSLFLVAHVTTVIYAVVEKQDVVLAGVFSLNAMCCTAIVGLVIRRRRNRQPLASRLGHFPRIGAVKRARPFPAEGGPT